MKYINLRPEFGDLGPTSATPHYQMIAIALKSTNSSAIITIISIKMYLVKCTARPFPFREHPEEMDT